MADENFKLDTRDFDIKFDDLIKNSIPGAVSKGLFIAGSELLRMAIEEAPQCPKDVGDLWGSGKVKPITGGYQETGVEVSFNSKYAAYQHEQEPGKFNYTTNKGASHPGPKFLETKIVRHKQDLMELVAEAIRKLSK